MKPEFEHNLNTGDILKKQSARDGKISLVSNTRVNNFCTDDDDTTHEGGLVLKGNNK